MILLTQMELMPTSPMDCCSQANTITTKKKLATTGVTPSGQESTSRLATETGEEQIDDKLCPSSGPNAIAGAGPLVLWTHLVNNLATSLGLPSSSSLSHNATNDNAPDNRADGHHSRQPSVIVTHPRCHPLRPTPPAACTRLVSSSPCPPPTPPPAPRQSSSSVLFLVLNLFLLLPNLSHTLRVPYRYPHYPLFNKEILQGSSGKQFL